MRALLTVLLLSTTAWAEIPYCVNRQAPADATPLAGGALRVHQLLAGALRDRITMAKSASTTGFCVTSTASYLGADWLTVQMVGPTNTHLAFGLMAYAAGVQRFAVRPAGSNGSTADLRGAWHIGCAYARAGITRARVQFLAEHIEPIVGPHPDPSAWMVVVDRGFSNCGGK